MTGPGWGVGRGGGLVGEEGGGDGIGRGAHAGVRKVPARPRRLDAVVGSGGNGMLSERIVLWPRLHWNPPACREQDVAKGSFACAT